MQSPIEKLKMEEMLGESESSSDEENKVAKSPEGTAPYYGSEPVDEKTPFRHRKATREIEERVCHDRSSTPSKRSYQPTPESVNGARFAHLLLNPCQDVVRSLMQSMFGQKDEDLVTVIKEHRNKITKNLKPFQKTMLNKPSYKTLDFSIMYSMIKSLRAKEIKVDHSLKSWTPPPKCTTLYIALERIRLQRNEFAHLPDIEMTRDDLRYRWDIVRNSVLFIADHLQQKGKMEEEVDNLLKAPFNKDEVESERARFQEMRERLQIVLKMQEKIKITLMKLLEEIDDENVTTSEQDLWMNQPLTTFQRNIQRCDRSVKKLIEDAKFYVKTPAYDEMVRIISEKRHVVISGRKGDGKTALVYYFLYKLMHETDVKVYVVSSPSKYPEIKDSKILNIVFIDDICSDKDKLKKFNSNSNNLERNLGIGDRPFDDVDDDEAPTQYLIMTARSNYIEKATSRCMQPSILLAQDCIVDMSTQNIPITIDRQKEIIHKRMERSAKLHSLHSKKDITSFLSDVPVFAELPVGFPYVAEQFARKHAAKSNMKFLTDPFHFFYDELATLLQNDAKLAVFVQLAVLGDSEGKPIEEIISDYKDFLGCVVSAHQIRESADLLEYDGTFLRMNSNEEYCITHPSIKRVTQLIYIRRYLRQAVKRVNIDFLLSHISVSSNQEYRNDITYYVTTLEEKQIIANCVLLEIENCGGIKEMLGYDMWQDREFVEEFVRMPEEVNCLIKARSGKPILLEAISRNYVFLVEQVIERLRHEYRSHEKVVLCVSEALLFACQRKTDLKIVERIMEAGADVSYCRGDSESPISTAVLADQEEILICLLEKKAVIPKMRWQYWDLLHSSAKQRDTYLCNTIFFKMLLHASINMTPPNTEASEENIWWKVARKSFEVDLHDFFYVCTEFIGISNELLRAFLEQGLEIKGSKERGNNVFHVVLMAEETSLMTDVQISKTISSFSSHHQFAFLINEENAAGETPLTMALNLGKSKQVLLSIIIGMSNSNVSIKSGEEALKQCIKSDYDDDTVAELINALLADCLTGIKREYAIQIAISQGQYRLKTISALLGDTKILQSSSFKPMHYCIKLQLKEQDKIQIIETLVGQGCDIDEKASDSKTPLMSAVEHCSAYSVELIKTLLTLNAEVDIRDNNNNNILHYCFSSNCSDDFVFRLFTEADLLSYIRNPNMQNSDNMTPALLAAKSSKTEAMKELLKVELTIALDRDHNGNTVLHLLVLSSRCDEDICSLVKICIAKYRVDPHTANNDGKTPLMLALESKQDLLHATVPYLLTLQPEMMHKDKSGKTVLYYCIASCLPDERICSILGQVSKKCNVAELNILQQVIEHEMSRPNTVLYLLSEGNQDYVLNACRLLMLHRRLALENLCIAKRRLTDKTFRLQCSNILKDLITGNCEPEYAKTIVDALLDNNIDINVVLKEGKTPLHLGIVGNTSLQIVEFLLDRGANVNAVDSQGRNALQFCLRSDRKEQDMKEMLLLLLERGTEVNGKDRRFCTPLMEAARKGHTGAIKILVNEYHANVDESDRAGKTALHHCIEADLPDFKVCSIIEIFFQASEDTIGLLANECAFTQHQNKLGLTLLNTACSCTSRSRVFTILQLLQMNSDVETIDDSGRSPICNVVRCLDRQDTKSQVERLARLSILQAYGCDPGIADDEDCLPKDICKRYGLYDELRMLQQCNSQREMNRILADSVERISNEETFSLADANEEQIRKFIVHKDDILNSRMKENILKIEHILRNVKFNRQDDESQLSEIVSP